jgi:hypothetical protein
MTDGLREGELNVLLRRVDWRFLLNQQDAPRSVCFASGLLARAVELVSGSAGQSAPFDLAALVNPSRRELKAAWEALRPGGEIYAEWRLPALGGHGRARRRLEEAGFADVRCYWPWPRPDRSPPQFWLPLEAPGAVRFFLASRRETAPRAALSVLWRFTARLGLLAPICVVARKSSDSEPLERRSWLLLTGGRRSSNKVIGLAFDGSAVAPSFLVKFARRRADEEPLAREAAALKLLEAERPDLRGVPRALARERRCGRLGLAESFLTGEDLMHSLRSETFAEVATLVTDWLGELAGDSEPQPRTGWWQRLVEQPVSSFERTFPIAPDEAARGRSILATLGDLPLGFEHRDCAPWNVLLDGGDIRLADWESAEPNGLPGLDLVYFLTYGAFLVEGALASGRTKEAYRRSLDPASRTGAIVRTCEERYCARLDLDSVVLRPLRVLCWILHSRSEHARLELDAGSAPTAAALHESLFLALWREEVGRDAAGVPHTS